jgi:GT2 family glycosyltransferase
MEKFPKLGIVYLSYHSEPYFDRLISSLQETSYPLEQLELIIVDNPHPEFGSSEKILREKVGVLSNKDFPRVTILPQEKNLGFAGGMNAGIRKAFEFDCKYIYLHNQDGFTDPKALEKIVEVLEKDITIGAAQSLMMLYPETDLINTSGNNFHYLGFGYVNHFKKNLSDLKLSNVRDIGYASGAAVLLRSDLLQKYGLWDEDYFFYHEDLEYSLRLKLAGYRVVAVKDSVFYHQYEFSRNKNKYYFMERNRSGFLLTYYKLPTLLVLMLLNGVVELGMLGFAIIQGWGKEKIHSYFYWMRPKNWSLWLKKRRHIQSLRTVRDKEIIKQAVSEIYFEEAGLDNALLRYIANPLMKLYFIVIKIIIFW